jgi:A/G-specific adenine glycosylase
MNFTRAIIGWYDKNKRSLPWRDTRDPYKIWVSEVILQQTRVEQGLSYYRNFVEAFPDARALASAPEDELMKSWQGLGYYSRARHMHQAARQILEQHAGEFPASYPEIRSLKGVGDYTAAAVASIAYGLPHPVVDGNVMRVMARFAGITGAVNTAAMKKELAAMLEALIDRDRPGDFNQAVMELGATVCLPRSPLCGKCPLNFGCFALQNDMTSKLPVLKRDMKVAERHINYLAIVGKKSGGPSLWLRRRTSDDIWKNLYDLPEAGGDHTITSGGLDQYPGFRALFASFNYQAGPFPHDVVHKLSHRKLVIRFFVVFSSDFHSDDLFEVAVDELDSYPVPKPVENFLKKFISDRVYFAKNRINR